MADPTFDGVTLDNASTVSQDLSNQSFKVVLRCATSTSTRTNLDLLKAKWIGMATRRVTVDGYVSLQSLGTTGSLVYLGTTYTNCMITNLTINPSDRVATHWEYIVTIERHTAG